MKYNVSLSAVVTAESEEDAIEMFLESAVDFASDVEVEEIEEI